MTSTLQVVVNIRDGVFKGHSHVSEQRRPQEMVAINFTKPLDKPSVYLGSLKLF